MRKKNSAEDATGLGEISLSVLPCHSTNPRKVKNEMPIVLFHPAANSRLLTAQERFILFMKDWNTEKIRDRGNWHGFLEILI